MKGLDLSRDKARALALVPVSRETEARLDGYVELLLKWQSIKNLVSESTLTEVWTRHIADCAQLSALVGPVTNWIDLGSGAGLPGLVIACLRAKEKGLTIHLVESNSRKCAFLRAVARELELPVKVHDIRVEPFLSAWEGSAQVVSARALAPLPELLTMSRKLLTSGAVGLFPKGQDVAGELTSAAKYWRIQASMVASKTDPKARIVVVTSAEPQTVS